MARDTFYLTTAIDYANAPPHLGHALEKIQADCIARYRRLDGRRVHFVTGLDEHGQTVAATARRAGVAPQAWVDAIASDYQHALRILAISCDEFVRTTQRSHAQAVREVLRRIRLQPAAVYEADCRGFYCGGCETFKLPAELVDGGCREHSTLELEWVEERAHFFRLSAYADRLRAHYDAHPEFVVPASTYAEIRQYVAGGLPELAISRSQVPWGIPFPGAPEQTFHVWFDALVNYLSAAGFPEPHYERLWPPDLQIVGPDIVRFHAVIWPALLMAADLELPRQIWTHGWLRTEGARFSKAAGVRVELGDAIARHGPDALRYFLLRTMPPEGDGEFSWERFDRIYEQELAGNLGKAAARAAELIFRHRGGRVPATNTDTELDRSQRTVLERYQAAMDALRLSSGALELYRLGRLANRYADEIAPPSSRATTRAAAFDDSLAALHRALVRIAALAQPFMPGKAVDLFRMVGGRGSLDQIGPPQLAFPNTAGWQIVSDASPFTGAAAR